MNENWKQIPNYPHYEVSDLGRIRSLARLTKRRNRYGGISIYPIKTRLLKPARTGLKRNYLFVSLVSEDTGKKSNYIHRLVLSAFAGPCPEGMEGCHNNGQSKDNRLSNLRWDTHQANTLDAMKHGTAYVPYPGVGEVNPSAKFTNEQYRMIAAAPCTEYGDIAKLARELKIPRATVHSIRERWKNE